MKKITFIKAGAVCALLISTYAFVTPSKKEGVAAQKIGYYEKQDCTYFNPSNGETSPGKKCVSGSAATCVSPSACYQVANPPKI